MKSVRNNWLAQKDQDNTFLFPSFPLSNLMKRASFSHLRKLYEIEKQMTIKIAPALNKKSMFSTNTEKQNVPLMLKVFNTQNNVALSHYESQWNESTDGTREFNSVMTKLWNIMYVKDAVKGIAIRKPECLPIYSMTDDNIGFLTSASFWLESWDNTKVNPRGGALSHETMFALKHTVNTMIDLCRYMLEDKRYQFVLLGKFQTDNLEFRFGRYRQLSGCNYNVSLRQVLDGEKNLKLISVLRLTSASKGPFLLKDLTKTLQTIQDSATSLRNDDVEKFSFKECDKIEISPEESQVLVYIAGYAASQLIHATSCDVCLACIRIPGKKLSLGLVDASYSYLKALDRGGLLLPSQTVVDIVTEVYVIFKVIIECKESEELLLQCGNQRYVLQQLAAKRLKEKEFEWHCCESCEQSLKDTMMKACNPTINILLKNYSKMLSDAVGKDSARKLKTFQKRI